MFFPFTRKTALEATVLIFFLPLQREYSGPTRSCNSRLDYMAFGAVCNGVCGVSCPKIL